MAMSRTRFNVDGREFVSVNTNGDLRVSSVNPYDETDYHWARLPRGSACWEIIRDRKTRGGASGRDGATLTTEEVCRLLNQMDKDANLHRTGGIW
jgi:hypothetical protein